MTVEDDILKELKWQSSLEKAQLITLQEIKFEMINSRKRSDATYLIPTPKKKGVMQKIREKLKF